MISLHPWLILLLHNYVNIGVVNFVVPHVLYYIDVQYRLYNIYYIPLWLDNQCHQQSSKYFTNAYSPTTVQPRSYECLFPTVLFIPNAQSNTRKTYKNPMSYHTTPGTKEKTPQLLISISVQLLLFLSLPGITSALTWIFRHPSHLTEKLWSRWNKEHNGHFIEYPSTSSYWNVTSGGDSERNKYRSFTNYSV